MTLHGWRRHASTAAAAAAATATRGGRTTATTDKVWSSAAAAVHDLRADSTVLFGGFGLCGIPGTLIEAVRARPDLCRLTAVSNNGGMEGLGIDRLIASGQIARLVASYVGENRALSARYLAGALTLELVPQGTLAERCRAGGAGIPAFYTPTAYGTHVQTGELALRYAPDGHVEHGAPRDVRVFGGRPCVLEHAIAADYALVRAHRADRFGNLQFRLAAHNFNGVMARNARLTIVEAEHIVEPGEIPPDAVHVPGIYVHRIVPATAPPMDSTTARDYYDSRRTGVISAARLRLVKRAAREFRPGMYANLGIGIPMMVPDYLPPDMHVFFQSENGLLGLGPRADPAHEDADLVNAGKYFVTLSDGAACFGSDESFAMIRSGKIDITLLGAMQVSMNGDLANWVLPNKVKGMGGAMDLVSNPEKTKIIVTMEHTDKDGNPKIMDACTLPLTGRRCVSRIITDLAVFQVHPTQGLILLEVADHDCTVDHVAQHTHAPFKVADDLKTFDGEAVSQ